jgi:hypothetical protein
MTIWIPTIAFALVLAVAPALVLPAPPVIALGLAGGLLVATGAVTRWRWPTTLAAGVFLTSYAGARWATDAPLGVAGAVIVGLSLLFLLESADLADRVRGAAVTTAVLRTHLARGTGFALATLVAAALAVAVASALATPMPGALAPVFAAAGALGVVAAIALIVRRALTRTRT